MSALFQPLRLREVTLRNRIAVSPMCQYSAREGVPPGVGGHPEGGCRTSGTSSTSAAARWAGRGS